MEDSEVAGESKSASRSVTISREYVATDMSALEDIDSWKKGVLNHWNHTRHVGTVTSGTRTQGARMQIVCECVYP